MYGDAHKKLVKSGDWRETHRPAHAPLHHRRHRTRPGLPGLGRRAGPVSMRRWRTGCWPSSAASSGATCARAPRTLRGARPGRRSTAPTLQQRAARGRADDAMRAFRRRRCRAHGPRHRDRVRLCRPPHRADRPAPRAATEAWQRLRAEATRRDRRQPDGPGAARRADAGAGRRRSPRASSSSTPTARAAALAGAELVFEGVPETLDAKRDAFEQINRCCRDDAILTSTTSSILVTQLAGAGAAAASAFSTCTGSTRPT